jgi:hypothetical protein
MQYRHVFGLFAIVCLIGAGALALQTPERRPPAMWSRSLSNKSPLQDKVDEQGREIAALKETINNGATIKLNSLGDVLSFLGLMSGSVQMLIYVFLGGKLLVRGSRSLFHKRT